jgi:hypothetical protein
MPFDELFELDATPVDDLEEQAPELEMDLEPDASAPSASPRRGADWDDRHAEDRLLDELQAWARQRGFDRRQRRVLSEALLLAFDRAPELPELVA